MDLRQRINYEAEKQLTKVLAAELAAEIDREILEDIRNSMERINEVKKKKQTHRSINDDWEVSCEA
jgi:hypothetical protein